MFTIYLGNFITFESDNIMDYKEICLRYLGGLRLFFYLLVQLLSSVRTSQSKRLSKVFALEMRRAARVGKNGLGPSMTDSPRVLVTNLPAQIN